jgi:predicted Zn-dependent protease
MRLKKWEEAIAVLKGHLKREPNSVPGVVSLANALTYAGKRGEALSLLIQSSEWAKSAQRGALIQKVHVISRIFISHETSKIYQEGLNLLIAKKYRAAKEKFEKALVEEPDNSEILIRIGQTCILENELKPAIERLRSAKKLDPFEPMISLWLGRALFLNGGHQEAIQELKMSARDLPGSELATIWLAEALSTEGQIHPAIRVLERDIKGWPFHVNSLVMIARLRTQLAHPDATSLWAARKDLQLALSRLDQYSIVKSTSIERELSVDLRKSPSEIKGEIQRLLQQVQSRLDEAPAHR